MGGGDYKAYVFMGIVSKLKRYKTGKEVNGLLQVHENCTIRFVHTDTSWAAVDRHGFPRARHLVTCLSQYVTIYVYERW